MVNEDHIYSDRRNLMKKRIAALFGAAALATGAFVSVGNFAAPAPAQAASCQINKPAMYSVYNISCSSARHFNTVGNSRVYAAWVGKARTSMQVVCAVNAKSPGAQVKI